MNPDAMLDRYKDALHSIPPPGCGCHPFLLSTANLGIMAGLEPHQLHDDIQQSIPQGNRRIPDKEIMDAVNKALADHKDGTFTPRPRPAPAIRDGKAALQKIIDQAKINDEADLWESSPVRLLNDPAADTVLLLEILYEPDDLIFIGDRHQAGIIGDTIRPAANWITYFQNGGKTAPHIIINPLAGTPAPTKSGNKTTLRGDACVKDFRYCLVEFDGLNREEQIKFWTAVKLPIVVLIDSGNKSIHGWLDVQKLATAKTPEQWDTEIKGRLYDQILKPLGVDGACSNPARLSRLPGHFRSENAIQKILWLSPEGKPLC